MAGSNLRTPRFNRRKYVKYIVEEAEILQLTDVEEMLSQEDGTWNLTLFACTIGGKTRVTVRCNRVADVG